MSRKAASAQRQTGPLPNSPETTPAVVVIGGSRGIGRAIAKRFATAGHRVVLVARHVADLEAAAAQMGADHRGAVMVLPVDVTKAEAPALIDEGLSGNGLHIDVLVNSAAMGLSGPFADQSPEEIEALLTLNVMALTRLTRHVLPRLKERRSGGIINIASLGGYAPGPNQAAYYASKAYVLSLSEALASELAGSGVKVCAVAPGPVLTGFHTRMGAQSSLYLSLFPTLSAERVAGSAYWGFKLGRRVVVPGLFNILMGWCLRLLPHPITVPIIRWLLRP